MKTFERSANQNIMKVPLLLSACLLGVATVAACGSDDTASVDSEAVNQPGADNTQANTSSSDRYLTVGLDQGVDTLDPAINSAGAAYGLIDQLFDGLTRFKPGTAELEPNLASKWETDESGTVWTVTLEDGVLCHDGADLDSADVVYSLNRLTDPDFASPHAKLLATVQSVEAVTPTEVKITTSSPDPILLQRLALPQTKIVCEEAATAAGADFGQSPIGSGPFSLEAFTAGGNATFVAFPDYWRGAPELSGVNFVPIEDVTTLETALETGEVDAVQINSTDAYSRYSTDSNFSIVEVPLLGVRIMNYRIDQPPFDDIRVREAFGHAINQEAMVSTVFNGLSTAADAMVPPGVEFRAEGLDHPEYDPERSRELLAEAGYGDGLDVSLLVPNTERFTTPAEIIQQDLAAVGVNVALSIITPSESFAALQADDGPNFWLFSRTYNTATPDQALNALFHSESIPDTNYARVNDSNLDSALDAAASTIEATEREASFSGAQEIIADNYYAYPIDYEKYIWVTGSNVSGFTPSPLRSFDLTSVAIAAGG